MATERIDAELTKLIVAHSAEELCKGKSSDYIEGFNEGIEFMKDYALQLLYDYKLLKREGNNAIRNSHKKQ